MQWLLCVSNVKILFYLKFCSNSDSDLVFGAFSAGIGRTGVLITMETAICLIEANQPVYPLDIVRQMRDQRAMLIQTPVSDLLQSLALNNLSVIRICVVYFFL